MESKNGKIENEDINKKRSSQKDNFSIKLFTKINDWVINEVKSKYTNIKIYKPNYYHFTHNTNMIDIYFYLGLQYKNILCITQEIKKELDTLLIDLKIKTKYIKEADLTKKSKEYKELIKYNYIKKNDELNDAEIKKQVIEFLKNEGYKDPNDNKFYKEDKDNICKFLIEKGLKKKYNYQKKNRNNIFGHKINEINKILAELIKEFYNSGTKFANFCRDEKTEKINEYVKNLKNGQYSLIDNLDYNGFIKMVEEDCGLNDKKKIQLRL